MLIRTVTALHFSEQFYDSTVIGCQRPWLLQPIALLSLQSQHASVELHNHEAMPRNKIHEIRKTPALAVRWPFPNETTTVGNDILPNLQSQINHVYV